MMALFRTRAHRAITRAANAGLEQLEGRVLLSGVTSADYATGDFPSSLIVRDFNGDGKGDVATAEAGSDTVSVRLNNGDGTFAALTSYLVGNFPKGMASADFNGDGHLDLVVADNWDANVAVLLGQGDGTFDEPRYFATFQTPCAVSCGDFDGDRIVDLAVMCSNFNSVNVLLGKGDGSFGPAKHNATGTNVMSAASGDLDANGTLDLVVANAYDNSISVLLGDGNGTFQRKCDYATGQLPVCVVVADLDRDGHLDLATANGQAGSVSVLLGDGDGTFAVKHDYGSGSGISSSPASLVSADFNADGNLDLAVANVEEGSISILRGDGTGAFVGKVDYPAGSGACSIIPGDLDGDSWLDVAVANQWADSVSVMLDIGALRPPLVVSSPRGVQSGDIAIEYVLTDEDSRGFDLQVQYSADGGNTWRAPTPAEGSEGVSNAGSSAAGELHTFAWASGNDIVGRNVANVIVRLSLTNSAVATVMDTDAFRINNAPNERPAATVHLLQHAPGTDDILVANVWASDPDGDPVRVTLVWKVNGVVKRTYTAEVDGIMEDRLFLNGEGNGGAGDTITVEATPNDGKTNGAGWSDSAIVVAATPQALEYHPLRFFLDPALVGAMDSDTLAGRLSQYAADINLIFSKQTIHRFVFDPVTGVTLTPDKPRTDGSVAALEHGYEMWASVALTDSPVYGTYGGYLDFDPSGARLAAGLRWDAVHDPSTLAAGSAELGQYWRQIDHIVHEFEHAFGAGSGEYYNLANVEDTTGVAPCANISFEPTNPFWSQHEDYFADPLLHNIWGNPRVGSPVSLEDLRNTVRFADVTAAVINRAPGVTSLLTTLPDLTSVKVRVVDATTGFPLPNASARVWNVRVAAGYPSYELFTHHGSGAGEVAFTWDPYPRDGVFTSWDFLKLIKVSASGYVPAAQWVTAFDAQATMLLDNSPEMVVTIGLALEPGANAVPFATVNTPPEHSSGDIALSYVLMDRESDSCNIAAEYSVDGGETWHVAAAGTGGDGTTNLDSSRTGQTHTFVWASRSDIINVDRSNVRIRITPTDSADGAASTTGAFTVNNHVNQAPTDIGLSGTATLENQPAGTVVGSFATTGPDAGDTFGYTLVNGDGADDNARFTIEGNQLKTAQSFDYEMGTSYSIRVRTTDADGASFEKTFSIRIAKVVSIPDAGLQAAIRLTLNKPAGDITSEDMASLTSLAAQANVRDLTGLQYAINLESLHLYGNLINDVTPLSGLIHLTHLDLGSNRISDLTPLSELTQLAILELSSNQLSDVVPLSLLPQLTALDLSTNQIADVTPLAGLTQLTVLLLTYNQINDVTSLAGLAQLTILSVGDNQLNDITPLSGLTQLTQLLLASNRISDATPLSGLRQLTHLTVADNQINDVTPLSGLTQLVQLDLSSNRIGNVAPLSALGQLRYLNLADNQVSDLAALAGLSRLSQVDVSLNSIDVSAGSVASRVIQGWIDQDASVTWFPQRVISIPDAALQAAIRSALSKPDGDITNTDMESLTSLTATNAGIVGLSGLEHAVNLRSLDLGSNHVYDVRPLSGLKQLTYVRLDSNQVGDLSALAGLTQLTVLILPHNQINDVSPLAGLTQLTKLYLSGNQIGDVTPLAGLTQLTVLDLSSNQISDAASLSGLTQLTLFVVGSNPLKDISAFSALTRLTMLGLWHSQITDISPLSGLTQLTNLALEGNQISDVTPLAGLTQLTALELTENEISDVTPLSGLTLLTRLGLGGNRISDVAPLAGLIQLRELNLGGNQISNAAPLSALTQLTYLILNGNQVNDVTLLLSLAQLTDLGLSDNQINDLTPLAGLALLRDLWIANNQVSDLEALAGLSGLFVVDVGGNNLDVAPGSPSMIVIQGWLAQGASVTYLPQNTMAPIALTVSSASVLRNWPAGTLVGMLSATDPNLHDAADMTFSLVAGAGSKHNAMFKIAGHKLRTNALIPAAGPDSYRIRIRATDSGGLTYEKAVTITVAGTNVAPADVVLSRARVAERQASGTTVGTLAAVDANSVDSFTYSLVRGAAYPDNAAFGIVGDQLRTAAEFDFEARSSYSIRVRSADRGGLFCEKTITVRVKDVNEAPTGIALTNSTVMQHLPAGTLVGRFVGSDPDAASALSYTLVDGMGSRDNAMFAILNGKLKTAGVFDYATQSVYKVRVRVTDQGGLWFEKAIRIGVTQ